MERGKYDINEDWEFTMPFRILEVFIFLMLAAYLVKHPVHVNDFIPNSWMDLLKDIAIFGLTFYYMISAYHRIRHKQTVRAFLAIDYSILVSGILFLGVVVSGLLYTWAW